MDQSFNQRTPLNPEERAELRARAETVRADARDLIRRCVAQHEQHEHQRARHQERLTAFLSLRGELRGVVADYASALRRLEIAPENAVVLVKELIDEPMRRPALDVAELRRDIVSWAIEGYFAA